VILDASAIISILRGENDAPQMAQAVARAAERRTSVVTYVEAAVVIDSSRDPVSSRRLDDFFGEAQIRVEPVTIEQGEIARQAYRDFGKGRHRASLNFGDCFAYALARARREPLLFKGDDFCHTDVEPALNSE